MNKKKEQKETEQIDANWKNPNKENCVTFHRTIGEPEMLHIINSGFVGRYIVVWENSVHEQEVDYLNAEQIKDKHDIDIELYFSN